MNYSKKTKLKILTLLLILFLAFQTAALAIPASPKINIVTQPDGTTLEVLLKGDEFFHYEATSDGIPIIKNNKGIYNYAQVNKIGQIIDLGIKAKNFELRNANEQSEISQLQTKTRENVQLIQTTQRNKRALAPSNNFPTPANFPRTGSPKSLVILVNFTDVQFQVQNPQQAFTDLLNEEGYSSNGATGSARDYFSASTMGEFNPQFDVFGPYTLPEEMAYYGANDTNGRDVKAPEMIVDAVRLASIDGVDMSDYDTDDDGYIDNVFVYYAGYNEAEWGGENTVWPHRWAVQISNYSGNTIFNGKKLYDYACSSEFKGSNGTTMTGIGTFVHEFAHVLGLPDLYATNGANHHTLHSWSVMDYGSYLNNGRTPPAFSTFERFFLRYNTPIILSESNNNIELEPLLTSNNSFLISHTNEHNLIGNNPDPKEFFLLENRQKTGWDSYLPGHGLLIYRIRFDQNKLNNNTSSNDPSDMVVDIMEADGIADGSSLGGDPFPGTSNITNYNFKLAEGTELYKDITNITEIEDNIYFDFQKTFKIEADAESINFEANIGNTTNKTINLNFTNKTSEEITFNLTGDDADQFSVFNSLVEETSGKVTIQFAPIRSGELNAVLTIGNSNTHIFVNLIGNSDNNGGNSEPSLPVPPEVPYDLSGINKTNNSFTATWENVANADSYKVYVYTKEFNEGPTVIFEEDFSLITNGTSDSGAGSVDIAGQLDNFTNKPGWSGKKVYEAGTAVKVGTASIGGYIKTPPIDLSADNGNFRLYYSLMAWNGDKKNFNIRVDESLFMYGEHLDNSNYTFNNFYSDFLDGTTNSTISFEAVQESKARFFLGNLRIEQSNVTTKDEINDSPFSSNNLNLVVSGLNNTIDYYYQVTAINEVGESERSAEVGPISLLSTAIDNISSNNFDVKIIDRALVIESPIGDTAIQVITAHGQIIYQGKIQSGTNNIELPNITNGLVLIRIGKQVYKIIQ